MTHIDDAEIFAKLQKYIHAAPDPKSPSGITGFEDFYKFVRKLDTEELRTAVFYLAGAARS
jgi:hypothetical protein